MKVPCIQISMTLLGALTAHAQDDELRGIRGLAVDGFWETHWQWAAPLCAFGLVAFIALAIWAVKRVRRPKSLSARERAMQELTQARALLAHDTPEGDKAYAVAVSQALRGYLERAVGLRAPEQTTEEFLQAARSSQDIEHDALRALEEFLKLCDLAKFARHAFGHEEREQLYQTAKTFIAEQDAKPLPTAPSAAKGESENATPATAKS